MRYEDAFLFLLTMSEGKFFFRFFFKLVTGVFIKASRGSGSYSFFPLLCFPLEFYLLPRLVIIIVSIDGLDYDDAGPVFCWNY